MTPGPMSAAARALSWLVPLAAAFAAWRPVVDSYFYQDDFIHLYDLVTLRPLTFLTQTWAGHLNVVSNAVSLGLFQAFGPDPRPGFWLMLLTHLLNVMLLHRVIRRLTGDALLAGAGAVWWGTCPTLEGALGWFAVYGQVLLTTLVLVVLGSLAEESAAARPLPVGRAVAWGALLAAGGACFGSGLAIAAVFPLVALIVFPPPQRAAGAVAALAASAIALLAVYAAARRFGQDVVPEVWTRLSWDVVAAGLPVGLALLGQLPVFAAYALVAGFLPLELHHPGPATALGAAAVAAIVAAGWRAADARGRRLQLALWLLVFTSYAVIVAGRLPLHAFLDVGNAATWPRYHYLGLALLTLVLSTALGSLGDRGSAPRRVVHVAAVVWTAVRLAVLTAHPLPIDRHDAERAEVEAALAGMRQAVAAAPPGQVARIENQRFAYAAFAWLFPGWAGLFVVYVPGDVVEGRTVRFIVSDGDWARARARGGRVASLMERR